MTYPIDPNTYVNQVDDLNFKVDSTNVDPLQAFLQEFGVSSIFVEGTGALDNSVNYKIESLTPPNPPLDPLLSGLSTTPVPNNPGAIATINWFTKVNGAQFLLSGFSLPNFGTFSGSDGLGTGNNFSSIDVTGEIDINTILSNAAAVIRQRINYGGLTSFNEFINKLSNLEVGDEIPGDSIGLPPFGSYNADPLTINLSQSGSVNYNQGVAFNIKIDSSNTGATFNAMMQQFGSFLGFDYDPNNPNMDLGDLSILAPSIPSGESNLDFVKSLFNNAFSAYLKSDLAKDAIDNGDPFAIIPPQFFENWKKFLTTASALSGPTPGTIGSTDFPNVNTYKDIYLAMVPGSTEVSFQQAFQSFYSDPNGSVQKSGYFLPSQFLGEWVKQAGADRLHALGLDGLSSVTNSDQTAILFRVFELLEDMLTALQNVAISQANKETFYANIQSEYTNLISKIPVYTIANLRATGFTEGDNGLLNNRLQSITNKNQAYTQNLQAFRDLFGDQAKQQQTAIDQSNQEVTQQANLATTILQQMSTIVQSIFSR